MAGVTKVVRAARDRLSDRVAIGVLTRTFPPELIDEVVDEAQAREQRKRSLPARLTTYFTLAMWLWREHGYEEVLRQLIDGLSWSEETGPDEVDFRDATSGVESYGAGRFVVVPGPLATISILDLNTAFLPPCALNPLISCPLPPPGNVLRAGIRAGERDVLFDPEQY